MVFVLDKQKKPLMPCTPKRARLLLTQGRTVVHRVKPFVIRLRDRRQEESILQEGRLKLDPGSKTTGLTLVRVEQTPAGEVHHALLLAEVQHRGEQVHHNKVTQRQARRRRRSANLRHRTPRFENRTRPSGWLPPSLLSRVGNLLTWAARCSRWFPVRRIEVERVRFDTQLLQNPEIGGKEYQEGTLAGWEARTYLLLKYEYRCIYCGKTKVPFEVDHVIPRSRGGSNRISNLVLSCHDCNATKGNLTAAEWGHPEVEAHSSAPLKDAAAVNATRFKVVEALQELGLPIGTWSGGRTRWNRARFGHREDPRARCPMRGRPGRSQAREAQNTRDQGEWTRAALPHAVDQVWLSACLSAAPEDGGGLHHGRSGEGSGACSTEDSRHACRTGLSTYHWLLCGQNQQGYGRWHQRQVSSHDPARRRL